jgi:hypothetical protein
MLLKKLLLLILLIVALPLRAEQYMSAEAFLQQAFDGHEYSREVVWLDKSLQQQLADILGHRYAGIRVRYAGSGDRTAWILEEIGKDLPITIGVVVSQGQIAQLDILAFRESRGWEVRYPFFTKQFFGAELDEKQRLTQRVDNISGATLSVRAVKKVARIALLLDNAVRTKAG